MNILSKNILRSETACKCGCGFQAADVELVQVIQDACDYFADIKGLPRVVARFNSWCRCPKHNKDEGGVDKSYHTLAWACDWYIEGVTPRALWEYLTKKYPDKYGIGLYVGRVHTDIGYKNHYKKGVA